MAIIQPITSSDYLKPLPNMNIEEQKSYLQSVREWMETKAPLLRPKAEDRQAEFLAVMAAAQAWNDAEVKAFQEGCVLITALAKSSEGVTKWLPDGIYRKSARRVINGIYAELDKINRQYAGMPQKEKSAAPRRVYQGEGAPDTHNVHGSAQKVEDIHSDAAIAAAQKAVADGTATETQKKVAGSWIARPPHIDQYIHLLPERTQKRAATVKGLHLELAEAHELLEKLADNPSAHPGDRATMQKRVTRIEDTIADIYMELNEEWEKLVKRGGVVVDDFGVARVVGNAEQPPQECDGGASGATVPEGGTSEAIVPEGSPEGVPTKKRGRPSKAESEAKKEAKKAAAIAAMTDEERAKRREYLKKWLRDTRTAKSPKHDEQWVENMKELLALGGEITDAMRKAAAFYELGIE